LRIELELLNAFGEWVIIETYHANSSKMLYKKIEEIKSMYVLQKDFRIFLVCNSKVNTYLVK
jgi:hypothetical protein